MKFNRIYEQLTDQQIQSAENKFDGLLIELACRSDNQHVGTGMGGNLHQLITLLNMKHTLDADHQDIEVCGGWIAWGSDLLLNASRKDIRAKLNQAFENIAPVYQQPALDFQADSLNNYPINRSAANQQVLRSLEDGSFQLDETLTNIERFQQARFICQELAARLDNNDTGLIDAAGRALRQFSDEINVAVVRKFIALDRVVNHSLDEYPVWDVVLSRLIKKVDAE